ncbi:MAG: hypothetical protein E7029_11480 [Planctomycetaceae bacterium]|nr:hypothetical protein [Planctomycetaceae bacterium]
MTQKIHFPFVLLLAALLFMAAGPAVFGDSGGGPADAAGMGDSEAPSFAETERALQKLNWKITVAAYSFRKFTFWETVDQVSEMGIDSLYGFNFQTVGGGIEGKLDPAALSDEALWKIRTKLDSAGLELTALYYGAYPSDEAACRRIFERSRMLGVRYFVSEPRPEQLPMLERLGEEYGITVGMHGHDKKSSPNTWHPSLVMKECAKYSPAIGAFSDTGHWIRSGLEPAAGVAVLKGRTVGLDLHDLNEAGEDVPLGTGTGKIAEMLETLAGVNAAPVLLGIEYLGNPEDPSADVKQSVDFLKKQAVRLASKTEFRVWGGRRAAPGFYVGAASSDITPLRPVSLAGQFYTRISQGVATPVTANAAVAEKVGEDGESACVIFVSIDTACIQKLFKEAVFEKFRQNFPDLDVRSLILTATHTHSAPDMNADGYYVLPKDGSVMKPSEYIEFASERVIDAIRRAWESRTEGAYSYGLGLAAAAYNRRAVYANGNAVMYGSTNDPNFRAVEGMEDHDVGCMFFWKGEDDAPAAILVNVACPSQVNGSSSFIDADLWHPARELLRQRYGKDVVVLGLCGAAGDQSPHIRYRHEAEIRMQRLRGLERTEELARRIVNAVNETFETVKNVREVPSVVKCLYEEIELPERLITKVDYENALTNAKQMEEAAANAPDRGASGPHALGAWHRSIVERWEKLAEDPAPTYRTCVRAVRIGDTVFCTNQFELYTDFGIQMKSRSPAVQTFVVQLCEGVQGDGTYLPSERAVKGGGYGAVVQSNMVGPEGGQILVERSLEMMHELFRK